MILQGRHADPDGEQGGDAESGEFAAADLERSRVGARSGPRPGRTGCRHFRPWPKHHQNSSVIAQYMRTVRRKLSVRRQNALGLSGRFWESRYDARIVSDPFSLVVRIAYDHRNPVKQSLVPRPEAYTWSTANEWATGEEGDIPICLQGPLPFGLSFDSLRRSVIHYQQSKALDDCGEEIEKFLPPLTNRTR